MIQKTAKEFMATASASIFFPIRKAQDSPVSFRDIHATLLRGWLGVDLQPIRGRRNEAMRILEFYYLYLHTAFDYFLCALPGLLVTVWAQSRIWRGKFRRLADTGRIGAQRGRGCGGGDVGKRRSSASPSSRWKAS